MKKVLMAVFTVFMLLGLAACSSDKANKEVSADSAIAAIKAKGKIVLLTEATFPPYEYVKGKGFDGADIEIGRIIAKKLGVELEVVDMNFDLLPEALNAGKGDFIAAGFTVTEERKNVVDFTIPYVSNSLYMIIPANSNIKDVKELADKVISAQEATTGDYYATDSLVTNAANVLRFKSAVEAGNSVATGKADACILDKYPAETIVKTNNGKVKILEGFNVVEDTAMAVKKGNTELQEFINEVLKELVEQNKVQELLEQHMSAVTEQ